MSATNRTTARGGKGSKNDKTNKPDKGDTGKGSADKVHQSGGGDSVRSNKNEDPAIKEKIRQIIELTQSSENEACLALHESDNDTERAVNFIFENRDQNWETRVKKKKSRQTSTSKDGASPAATGSTADTGGNNSTATVTAATGGGDDDDDWDDNPTEINTSGALSGGGNTGNATGGGSGYGNYDKTRGTSRGSGGPRMHGRQGGIGNNSGRDRDREGGGGGGGSWRGKERHENERNLDEGGGAGRRGRPGLPPRGGGGARGRGGGRAGGSSRYPPRTPQNRHTNSNYNNRMGTWDNSNTWDGGNSRDEVNHHSTAADDNWDEFHGEEWSTEEYTGSLSETKVFTSSQPTEPTPQDQDPSPIIPALETTTSTLSTSSITVEQSMVQAQLAQMAQMQQAAEAAVSVHQSAGGTVPPQQQTQQVQHQQSQPAPVAIVGTLNAEQAKYLNTLTQQNNMNISAGIKYVQQPQQSIPQSQVQQSQYNVTQTQTTGYISNYGQPYTDNTMQQQQSQQPRIKQRARIPPPSKIPSSAVEMPGDLNSTMGLLDLQFGAMDIMLDVTGSNVFVGGYDSNDGKYTGNLDTSVMQQQQSSATASSMDLNHSSVQQQNVIPQQQQQQQQQQMVDAYSPTKPSQQQQSSINSALSQGLENMQSVGVGNIAGGGDHIQTVTGYNTGARSGVVPSSTTGTNTSVVGVTSVGVGGSAIDTMTKVQQANIVDHQQQQQAQQAAVAAAAAAAQQQQQQQHTYSQQTNFNTVYGSGPTTVAKSNVASVGSNYQTQQQAYNTNNYSTNAQKPTDFQTANVTANYNYASNNGGGGVAGTANYNTSGVASNSAYQPYSNSNSYQQSTGSGNTTFITQANTYPANVATNPTYQQNTSQSVYGANTGLNNSTNYTGSSNSTSASAQYNSYGSSSGGTAATNHKSKDGNSAYDGSNSAGGVSGAVTSNTSSAAAAAALSLAQTTATSGSKVNTTLAKNSSGVVTNLPPGVAPVMSAPYLMASNTIPYFQQQPIYQYDELQLMQQRLPHMTAPFYDMSYQTPAAAATTLRDGSYSMSDGRFARSDSNASPVPSTQTSSQPLALAQTAPGAYFFAAPYANIQPGYQFGPAAAMYSQLPAGTNAHNANNNTPQYAKQQQQQSAATAYSGGYGYDSLSQAQDYGKSSGGGGGGYVGGSGGGGGAGGGGTGTGGSTGGSGSGSQGGQSKPGGGGATTNAVSVTGGPTGTGAGGSTNDLSAMYAKSHNTLGKVNSYDKQGFHSGTPPPFAGTLGQTGALAPSGTGYAPQMYIQQLPAHHQQHSTPLMHQPLHQMELRHHGRRMDGGNNSGQRTQSSNPSKTGSKQGYQSSYWNAP